MVGEGYVNEGWLAIRKVLLATEKDSNITCRKTEVILDFVITYVLKTQEKWLSQKRKYLNRENTEYS